MRASPGVRNPGTDRELLLDGELLAPVTGVTEYYTYAQSAEAASDINELSLTDDAVVVILDNPRNGDLDTTEKDVEALREDHCR